ncbi:MAG: hypothetical protein Q8O89_09145, partial [Nanoarchaeota archaeon]|nr:hypothetical protein [Nanoarchaeota archaeon]
LPHRHFALSHPVFFGLLKPETPSNISCSFALLMAKTILTANESPERAMSRGTVLGDVLFCIILIYKYLLFVLYL